MTEVAHLTATELVEKIRQRDISSVELTRLYIDRIERLDGDVNAVIARTFEDALAAAETADKSVAAGAELGPLHGLPMTIKESYAMAGLRTTWGNELFRNNVARADGLAVRRFREAGAHFLGKTNVPVDLADFQSYNPIYGTTGNPWDLERTPGGSSGGSAAALAAGFTGLEAGSDIGGSIRNPAHFCGVFGHKPTYGVVPMQGHELVENLPEADLAVCGPLARGALDLHWAMVIMAKPAPREAIAWQLDIPCADFERLADLRVALWPTDDLAPVSDEVAKRVQMVGQVLRDAGATVSEDARPDFDLAEADRNYLTLLNAVMTGAMTDADEARWREAVAGLAPDDQSRDAVMARAAVLSHRAWIRANTYRERLRAAWDRFFQDWDILVCPQMATTAFPHDHRPFGQRTIEVNGAEQPYFQQLFWAGMIVNAYLPSTVFPTGLSDDGLPIGLQAVSAPYRDHRAIEFARFVTDEIGGFKAPPGF